MAAGSIIVDLLLRTGSFVTDTARAEKRLKEFEKSVADAGTRLATGAAAIAGAIGGSIALLDRFASGIAAYQDIAEIIGDSASAVSSLQLAADQSGTSLDTVASASVKLTAALSKTNDETDATAKALAALNIPLQEFQQLNPVEQLERVAAGLAQFEDGASKTAVAVQLFGRSGAELIPFLNDLAESQGRNVRLTDEQIAAADTFTKTLASVRSELATTAKTVAVQLIPQFQAFLDFVKDSEVAANLLAAAGRALGVVFETLAVVAANVAFVFVGVGKEIGAVAAQLAALARFDIAGFNAISKAVKEDAARARAELDAFEKRILGGGGTQAVTQATRPTLNFSAAQAAAPRASRAASATAPRQSEAERYLETLQKQLERTKDLTVAEQVLTDIQAGRLGKVTAAQQASLVGIAEQIDAANARKKTEDELEKTLQKQADSFDRLKETAAGYTRETQTPVEELNAGLAEQQRLLEALGAEYEQTYSRKVADLFKQYDESFKKSGSELDDFSKNAAENVQRNFGDTIFNALQGNFKGIGDGFKQLLDRMVAEAIAADLAKALLGNLAGGSGEGIFGGIFKQFVGALGGLKGSGSAPPLASGGGIGGGFDFLSSIGSFFGGFFANGGQVFNDRAYVVGEQGPEVFVPRTAGMILPSQSMMGNKRSTVNNITVNVPQSVNRATGTQIAADVGRKLSIADLRVN